MSLSRKVEGFTITELVISITVAGFLTMALFAATFYYYANSQQAGATADLAIEAENILTQMTEDIRLSDAISTTNAITDAHSPGGGWVTSDPSNIIIIENPAIDSNRNIIYNSSTGSPYRNEFIYFLNGTSMYKRILANPSATGNITKTTCPTGYVTPTCPADRLFSSNVSNLTFTFYDSSDNTTANATLARSVLLTVNMAKRVYGRNVVLNNSTRVTLRNL
jgi:type II secretory pathway pseudopilin PulG